MSKYLEFKQVPYEGKTKRFEVISKNHGYSLGRISWLGKWRQYVFSPAFETVWNKDCLNDIQLFLDNLMFQRRIERNPIKFDGNRPDYITYDDVEFEPDKNE